MAVTSQAGDAERVGTRPRYGKVQSLLVAACATGFGAGCLGGYIRLGGGAAGAVGVVVLLAPIGAVAAIALIPTFRPRTRTRWAALLLGLALPYLLLSCELPEYAGRMRFDAAEWRAAAGGHSPVRLRQVDDLLASGRLRGRTREEVLLLLGPDDTREGSGWGDGSSYRWDSVYWLGPERGMWSIDSEWLGLRYDDAGSVSEARLIRD